MRRPRLLDLFCGEGGAGMGYHRAGFDVTGVDNDDKRLAHYPFEHHRADALEYLLARGREYDAIHASPTCTGYTRGTAAIPNRYERYDRLIAATREALREIGRPYVIENVEGARPELISPVLLCGRMFGLSATDTDGTSLVMDRHRLFESNILLLAPEHVKHDRKLAGRRSVRRRQTRQARGPARPEGRLRPGRPGRAARPPQHALDDRARLLPVDPARLHDLHRRPAHRAPGGRSMTHRPPPAAVPAALARLIARRPELAHIGLGWVVVVRSANA
ncbi:MAG: hypothetical protein QM714_00325 [Nocardioides sp.]|uniref:class I SAM-dependent methyltransferase n=1 Tax=Nocardioides sp. TaxID=35761 RepID=UPI0039E5EF58